MILVPGSLGDILALLTIAVQVINALRDATGSAAELNELVNQFETLRKTLLLLEHVVVGQKVDEKAVEDINREAQQCHKIVSDFIDRTKPYMQAFNSTSSVGLRQLLKDSGRKIRWSLFKKEEVQSVKDTLATHQLSLITLLSIANLETSRSTNNHIQSVQVTLQTLCPTIGYHPDSRNSIVLTDVLGRTQTLPWELCATREEFNSTLVKLFSQRPGEELIAKGNYRISSKNTVIAPGEWTVRLRRGMKIDMDVVINVTTRMTCWTESHPTEHLCTRCGRSEVWKSGETALIKCGSCDWEFKLSSSETPMESISDELCCEDTTVGCDIPEERPKSYVVTGGGFTLNRGCSPYHNDISLFRSIHIRSPTSATRFSLAGGHFISSSGMFIQRNTLITGGLFIIDGTFLTNHTTITGGVFVILGPFITETTIITGGLFFLVNDTARVVLSNTKIHGGIFYATNPHWAKHSSSDTITGGRFVCLKDYKSKVFKWGQDVMRRALTYIYVTPYLLNLEFIKEMWLDAGLPTSSRKYRAE